MVRSGRPRNGQAMFRTPTGPRICSSVSIQAITAASSTKPCRKTQTQRRFSGMSKPALLPHWRRIEAVSANGAADVVASHPGGDHSPARTRAIASRVKSLQSERSQ